MEVETIEGKEFYDIVNGESHCLELEEKASTAKKTVSKKTTKKVATPTAKKPTVKSVAATKVVETKKPTVVVETKKTDRCECGDNCNCGTSRNCCCKCGCIRKIVILLLILANLVIACLNLCNLSNKKSAWNLEALKVGWQGNLEKLNNELYSNPTYIQAQKESIDAYLEQLWIN